jgi:hypothetical protein
VPLDERSERLGSDNRFFDAALLAAHQVAHSDRVRPGREPRAALERSELCQKSDHDLLRRVFGVRGRAGEAQRKPVHRLVHLAAELFQCRALALASGQRQAGEVVEISVSRRLHWCTHPSATAVATGTP